MSAHTPGLAELQTGDYVWLVSNNYQGKLIRRLAQITAVNKGRLYICVPNAKHGYGVQRDKLLIEDWRYGFSTDTGTAKEYRETMSVATAKEVKAELEAQRKREEEEQARKERERRAFLVKEAAPELLEACHHALMILYGLSTDGEITMTPEGKDSITRELRAAIAKAEKGAP